MLLKLIKFIIVGFSGLAVDFGLTFLLKEKLKVNRFVANSIGFIAAASSNYYLNRWFTFQSQNEDILTEYSSFFIISLIGLAINNLFLSLLEKKMNFYMAKFIAIMLTTGWNFLANYYITFSAI
ncbi:GtrA family protein [Labilibacter marinus]|uniref:GtrA family protein n=1 Tax=Labilibacter marinus TaxID=1477105 RepID=UPI00082AFC1D|nr:GtrA family protein [Labilibacter marinus]